MKLFRKEEGFTLVELMVVVLIIGILVAVAIPVFNAASGSARNRTCQSNQRTIEGAVQQYLAADPNNAWAAGVVDSANVLVTGTYIKEAPACPSTGGGNYMVDDNGTITGDQRAATWVVDGSITHAHF